MKNQYLSNLLNKSAPHKEEARDYIGASSIGNPCMRSIWYSYNKQDRAPFSIKQLRTFEIGHLLEKMVITALQEAGLTIEVPCEANDFLAVKEPSLEQFQGHLDGILHEAEGKAILEIKTANDTSFNQFVKNGLYRWHPSYYDQVQSYMGMSGVKRGYILVINKNTSEVCDEFVEFNEYYYATLVEKAKMIVDAVIEPPKINSSPLYYICQQCNFKKVCHG